MRITTYKILFFLMLINPMMSRVLYAQAGFVLSFRLGSDILIDTYNGNALALSQLDETIKKNKSSILSNQGYIELVAGISADALSDKFALNIAATQASVVKSYFRNKYDLTDEDFVFSFSDDIIISTLLVSCQTGSAAKKGVKNIFFTPDKTNPDSVNTAIARFGATIPMLSKSNSTPLPENTNSNKHQEQTNTNYIGHYAIDFKYGSEMLYAAYMNNKRMLAALQSNVAKEQSHLLEKKEHIQIVSVIPESEKGNIAAINFASIRGAVARQWLMDNFSWLSESNFSFYISAESNRNAVEVSFIDSPIEEKHKSDIFFSLEKSHPEKIDYAVARYKRVPFLNESKLFEQTEVNFKIIDPVFDLTQTKKTEEAIDEKVIVTIYYRWDKDNLDSTYLTNAQTLFQIDSLLQLNSSDYIDSLRIVAYASPEGPSDYNKRLSQRRANTLKNYLLSTYPRLREEQISTEAKGANWDGFRRMAHSDTKLPMKEQVLSILNNQDITDLQRQSQITRLDGGRLYKNYILPHYYRYLRTGASLFVVYNQRMPVDIDFEPIKVIINEPEPIVIVESEPEPITKYPIALRTNLLYDAIGAVNIGIELPFGKTKNWSWIVDGAYSYWRSSKNLYALQTLEYGTEVRYWFGVSDRNKERNLNWEKPLQGWNIGTYGRCWQRYDVQLIDGVQGDDTWSAGITVGYAFPVSRSLSFEASIGGGWLSTSEYRHYHQPEYDRNGKYHLMWQETGKWSGLSITKVRFSLIWLIQHQKKGEHK